ncbi:titin-like [Ptychodera flava]|uniref:titin-like n=1 Tax=Ptychodera flava TaxID=63121 RepID=UPI003969EBBD
MDSEPEEHAPYFTNELPARRSLENGRTIALGVSFGGIPRPRVQWTKHSGHESTYGYTSQLKDVSVPGRYTVTISNTLGPESSSCSVEEGKRSACNVM